MHFNCHQFIFGSNKHINTHCTQLLKLNETVLKYVYTITVLYIIKRSYENEFYMLKKNQQKNESQMFFTKLFNKNFKCIIQGHLFKSIIFIIKHKPQTGIVLKYNPHWMKIQSLLLQFHNTACAFRWYRMCMAVHVGRSRGAEHSGLSGYGEQRQMSTITRVQPCCSRQGCTKPFQTNITRITITV